MWLKNSDISACLLHFWCWNEYNKNTKWTTTKCSRVFSLWRKSSFHIIPLSLEEQKGFPLTPIAAGADSSLGYQNAEGKVLWGFLPTVRIIQEPSFPKSGAVSWLCNLHLLEGLICICICTIICGWTWKIQTLQISVQSISDSSQFCGCLYQNGVMPC